MAASPVFLRSQSMSTRIPVRIKVQQLVRAPKGDDSTSRGDDNTSRNSGNTSRGGGKTSRSGNNRSRGRDKQRRWRSMTSVLPPAAGRLIRPCSSRPTFGLRMLGRVDQHDAIENGHSTRAQAVH